jgi:hypothetical protein
VVEAWKKFKKSIDIEPFLVSILVNRDYFTTTLVDTRCLLYRLINSRFAARHKLECIKISPCGIIGFNTPLDEEISEVAIILIDIDGHSEE